MRATAAPAAVNPLSCQYLLYSALPQSSSSDGVTMEPCTPMGMEIESSMAATFASLGREQSTDDEAEPVDSFLPIPFDNDDKVSPLVFSVEDLDLIACIATAAAATAATEA
ncbi:Aste57867_13826 [Aphanomyces stellatus]|uniref:Aste57867_13826 protein n=1 Tax=Aphanomyces stellatus TaxID=120398 RepID=A0A485KZH5_9STRA|nr:hypothetical protein As57867_013776 [Aphanomyces stellatus]VFT90658.1 Aste57867_13826 [Aphanomyces stellatus]